MNRPGNSSLLFLTCLFFCLASTSQAAALPLRLPSSADDRAALVPSPRPVVSVWSILHPGNSTLIADVSRTEDGFDCRIALSLASEGPAFSASHLSSDSVSLPPGQPQLDLFKVAFPEPVRQSSGSSNHSQTIPPHSGLAPEKCFTAPPRVASLRLPGVVLVKSRFRLDIFHPPRPSSPSV